jgi:2'-5' RNA ligase
VRLLRLFAGVEVSAETAAVLAGLQAELQRRGVSARWEEMEHLHITLHFLGATDPARVPRIASALDAAAAASVSHVLHLAATGAFPSTSRPKILWVGLGGELSAHAGLREEVVTALAREDVRREDRPYHAHVTIGRLRRDASHADRRRAGEAVAQLPAPPGAAWLVTRVVLFESVTDRGAKRYVPLHAAPLTIR